MQINRDDDEVEGLRVDAVSVKLTWISMWVSVWHTDTERAAQGICTQNQILTLKQLSKGLFQSKDLLSKYILNSRNLNCSPNPTSVVRGGLCWLSSYLTISLKVQTCRQSSALLSSEHTRTFLCKTWPSQGFSDNLLRIESSPVWCHCILSAGKGWCVRHKSL